MSYCLSRSYSVGRLIPSKRAAPEIYLFAGLTNAMPPGAANFMEPEARASLRAPLPPSESGVYARAVTDLAAVWPDAGARARAWRAGAGLSIGEAIAVGLGG